MEVRIRHIFVPTILIVLSIIIPVLDILIIIYTGKYLASLFMIPSVIFILILILERKEIFSYIEITETGIGKKYDGKFLSYLSWNDIKELKTFANNEIVFLSENQRPEELYKNRFSSIIVQLNIWNAAKKLAIFYDYYKLKVLSFDKITPTYRNIIMRK